MALQGPVYKSQTCEAPLKARRATEKEVVKAAKQFQDDSRTKSVPNPKEPG